MALIVDVKVVPSSGKSFCVLDSGDHLKCYLKNQPERGKANAELIALIAKALKIPRGNVFVILGQTTRHKRLKIESQTTYPELLQALAIECQMSLFKGR